MPTIKIIATPVATEFQQTNSVDIKSNKQNIPGVSRVQSISINIGRTV